jgi:hypothetical protein
MGANNPRLQVLERAEVFHNVAASIVEEQLAALGASDRYDPFEIVAIFKQIVDRLSHTATGDYRYLRPRLLFLFLLGHRFYLGFKPRNVGTNRLV